MKGLVVISYTHGTIHHLIKAPFLHLLSIIVCLFAFDHCQQGSSVGLYVDFSEMAKGSQESCSQCEATVINREATAGL